MNNIDILIRGTCSKQEYEDELWKLYDMGYREPSVDKLVGWHIKLTVWISGSMEREFGYPRGDLVSAGLLGLVTAVNRVISGETVMRDMNLTAYVTVYVKRFVREFMIKDHLMPVSRTVLAKGIIMPRVCGMGTLLEIGENDWRECQYEALLTDLEYGELERRVLSLRVEGYNYAEIAGFLDVSNSYVGKVMLEIQKKFEREFGRPRNARKRRNTVEESTDGDVNQCGSDLGIDCNAGDSVDSLDSEVEPETEPEERSLLFGDVPEENWEPSDAY